MIRGRLSDGGGGRVSPLGAALAWREFVVRFAGLLVRLLVFLLQAPVSLSRERIWSTPDLVR